MTPVAAGARSAATTTKAGGAAASPGKTNGTGKGAASSRLQELNGRLIRLRGNIEKLTEEVGGYIERELEGSRALSPLGTLAKILSDAGTAVGEGMAGRTMEKLHDMKWEPPKPGPRVLKPGEQVRIKSRYLERFTKHGAYDASALANLTVVSVHDNGGYTRVRLANGEALGVWPTRWFGRPGDKDE